ncbi:MAG: phosphotransferase [Pseudomonadota bacterium]
MTPLLDRAGIEALIPHAGAMSLWDALLDASERTVRLRTRSHRRADHPLRRDGHLSAVHLLEYGAQAMAVHGGWLAKQAAGSGARPGVLAAVRDLRLHVERLDDLDTDLECEAQRLVANAGGWMYAFVLRAGATEVGSGRASVIHMRG